MGDWYGMAPGLTCGDEECEARTLPPRIRGWQAPQQVFPP